MSDLDSYLAKLDSEHWQERANAARQLVRFDDERALAGLRRALLDPKDTGVTKAATEAMVASGNEAYIRLLLDCWEEADEDTGMHLHEFLVDLTGQPIADEVLRIDAAESDGVG